MKRRKLLLGSIGAAMASACGELEHESKLYRKLETELPIQLFLSSGANAQQTLKVLAEERSTEGSAFIIGSKRELGYLEDLVLAEETESLEETLEKAERLAFPADFRSELVAEAKKASEELERDPRWKALSQDVAKFRLARDMSAGEWPQININSSIAESLHTTMNLMTGAPHNEIYIGLAPTTNPVEIPAYTSFGGWNQCPMPEWHVAAMSYWSKKWGARIVALTSDSMEVQVAKRPDNQSEALILAREHYDYCSDIVDQGTGSLSVLAASLMASDLWFFWWD